MDMQEPTLRGERYTRVIVVLCFLMIFTALGFASSTRSLFVVPVTGALGIERSVYSVTDTLRFVSTSVVNLFFGVLIARFGARRLIGAGFFLLVLWAVLSAVGSHVLVFYLAGICLGAGLSFTTTSMVGYVVSRRCSKNRGTVMGAVLAANGLGGALATQLVTPLLYGDEPFFYRRAYVMIAAVLFGVGLLIFLLFRNSPDKEETLASPSRERQEDHASPLSRGIFLAVAACIFFSGFVLQGITGVAAAHMSDVGVDAAYIATVLSIHSLILAGSKFLNGFLYDHFGIAVTVTTAVGASVLVMLSLIFLGSAPILLGMGYAVFAALALPLETVMLPIYARRFFGDGQFDRVLGVFVSVNTAGYALGAPIINLCYDLTGSYLPAFFTSGALMLGVLLTLYAVIRKTRPTD